jgi:RNase P subunit RPR2
MRKSMDRICEHCYDLIVGNAYRVTSEEEGITLLDIIVCSLCFMEAQRLHLHAEEINERSKKVSARNDGVTVRDSEFNLNTKEG